ncbi:hypothetical protein [Streptomyces sp. NPDC088752]|uniref:hypothetical protein n=1 Tax=Streptomyces sp. NPDC088752 TaxID=3154963 RepID=UPI003417854B
MTDIERSRASEIRGSGPGRMTLRSVTGHYLDAGATRLVLAGVIEDQEERKLLADAVGVELSVCRFQAELSIIHQRLAQRHDSEPDEADPLEWTS